MLVWLFFKRNAFQIYISFIFSSGNPFCSLSLVNDHLSDIIFCVDKNAEMIWMFCPVWIGGQEMENHLSAHFCSSLNLTTFCSRHRDGRIFFQECAMGKWCRTITHLATKDCNKNFTMPIAYNTFPHSAVELKIYCQIFLGGRHFRSLHSKAI